MFRNREAGFAILNTVMVLALATAGTAGALVYSAGAIRVEVLEKHEGGQHINLIIPAAIVPVALAFVPNEHLQEITDEMREVLPLVRIAAEELARCPDGILVEVRDSNDHVLIQKRNGSLMVDVESRDEEVHVSFPLSMVVAAAYKLESLPQERAGNSRRDAERDDEDGEWFPAAPR